MPGRWRYEAAWRWSNSRCRYSPTYAVPTLVLHLAFLTQEKAKAMPEADYIAANRTISGSVLAALDRIGAEGVFLPSSGAVYMVDRPEAAESMRLYGRLKLEDEANFAEWSQRRHKRAVIARVFNLSGPYINKQSSYALASFIADALAGRPIEIRATRPVLRSYVAISELMSVVFGALTDSGEDPILFDTAGDDILEVGDIAAVVRRSLGTDRGVAGRLLLESGSDRYTGDGAVYRSCAIAWASSRSRWPDRSTRRRGSWPSRPSPGRTTRRRGNEWNGVRRVGGNGTTRGALHRAMADNGPLPGAELDNPGPRSVRRLRSLCAGGGPGRHH